MVDCGYLFVGFTLRVSNGFLGLLWLRFADKSRTCTSSMYTVTYDQIMQEFDSSHIVVTLGLSFFIWGLGMFLNGVGDGQMLMMNSGWTSFPGAFIGGLFCYVHRDVCAC